MQYSTQYPIALVFLTIVLSFYLLIGIILIIKVSLQPKEPITPELRQLHLAAGILTGVSLIFLIAMGLYFFQEGTDKAAGRDIFDACVKILPPIITLVLGYYFGRSAREPKPGPEQISNNLHKQSTEKP